jgi:hypothetical protein
MEKKRGGIKKGIAAPTNTDEQQITKPITKPMDPVYRTKEQRQAEIKEIISQLNNLQLGIHYPPIRNLFAKFKEYIDDGNRIEINIPFPDINRRIKGVLAASIKEDVCIMLKHEKF